MNERREVKKVRRREWGAGKGRESAREREEREEERRKERREKSPSIQIQSPSNLIDLSLDLPIEDEVHQEILDFVCSDVELL